MELTKNVELERRPPGLIEEYDEYRRESERKIKKLEQRIEMLEVLLIAREASSV